MPRNFSKAPLICVLGLMLSLSGLMTARPALAQIMRPSLISATPEPDSVFVAAPEQVVLDFNGALADEGSSLEVLDVEGKAVDEGDAAIDPANRSQMSVSLRPLVEGIYTVSYTAREIGGSVIVASEYTFIVQPPAPLLTVQMPVDGQSFMSGDITLDMGVQFFDFGNFDNRIRIYVDGDLQDEVRALQHHLTLSPGVHQLRVVLTRFDDEELDDTETIINIAVAEPPEPVKPPPATTTLANVALTPQAQVIVIVLILVLLVAGYVLGRQREERDL